MQKPKTGKISIFSPLDAKLESLAGRVELTQFPVGSSRVGLKIWATRLESGWKCGQPDFESSRIQNVNPKLDPTISLALIKRDHYSLSLIDETFTRIQKSKYLTQLNIIVAFNKLHMHSDNEDLTIFIIFFDLYKYHVMLFKLTNESTFYQHYMNDVLFEYLHQFCQIYLNDIIIYSKTLKKHKQHVQLILNKLREADLQIDINKCKFHVQKTIFLELLISIEELKMNSQKMQAVIDWSTLNNLTQMQFFIDFCNFYRCFIKNFSKIVYSMIQLTQKEIIFEWNEVCQIIFNHMKRHMIKTFILHHFN